MSNTLIIRINSQEPEPTFDCWTSDKSVSNIRQNTTNDLNELSNYLLNINKIIVLVPGENVLLTQVVMPHLSAGRLVKALQFALEDQLTEDPSRLHFAIGQRLANDELSVAIVAKAKMNAWQNQLRELLGPSFSKISAFIPDMLALPLQPGTISVLIEQNLARLKISDDMGYVFEKKELPIILELILAKQGSTKISTINFYQNDQTVYLSEQDQKRLGVSSHIQTIPAHALNLLAPIVMTANPINLLQRDYGKRHSAVKVERVVYLSALLVGLWLVLLTFTHLFEYYLLYREESVLRQNMKLVYQSVYPNAEVPTNPKIVLQNKLSSLRTSTQDSAFIRLISSVSIAVLPMTSTGLIPEKATYRGNQLSLELVSNDATSLNQLKQALEQIGLRVVMGSAERSTSGSIRTRFTIEEMS